MEARGRYKSDRGRYGKDSAPEPLGRVRRRPGSCSGSVSMFKAQRTTKNQLESRSQRYRKHKCQNDLRRGSSRQHEAYGMCKEVGEEDWCSCSQINPPCLCIFLSLSLPNESNYNESIIFLHLNPSTALDEERGEDR